MAKILFVQSQMRPPGGANGVAAWMLEALKQDHALTLLTWEPVDWDEVNRFYGTALQPDNLQIHAIPALVRAPFRLDPDRNSIQPTAYLWRRCQQLQRDYDLCMSAVAETDFGCRGIQYIHYPWLDRFYQGWQPHPTWPVWRKVLARWQTRCKPWRLLSHYSFARMKTNLSLVNSDWTGNVVKEVYGIDALTLYPPVQGDFPVVPWAERENGFVCSGRFHRDKRFEAIIETLALVRQRTPDLHLHIVGSPIADHPQRRRYYQKLRALVEANAAWVHLHENIAWTELLSLIAHHRYGIHAMLEEHFGMSVAELVAGGCITFIHNSGGQVEIVGGDDRLLYASTDEAAVKILAILQNPDEQSALRQHLQAYQQRWSSATFMHRTQEIVAGFLAER